MTAHSQNVPTAGAALLGMDSRGSVAVISPACPACAKSAEDAATERYGNYELFRCAVCDLQFWEPRVMPDARWYEQMYSGRDVKLMPLEPGHKYFLRDPLAPGRGELLDIGCGTGNFLVAARAAGYTVSGTELDRNAARFAKEQLDLPRVLGLTMSEFVEKYPGEKFDIVTFFEVLEHQAAPVEFVEKVKSCLRSGGYIALSVPNRERWLTGPDVLDYPPNHFLRWNVSALRNLLSAQGFEILSVTEQLAGLAHTAQMINMALRTGLTRKATGDAPNSFREVTQMGSQEAATALQAEPTVRQRAVQFLGRMKYVACFPLAIVAYPYVRLRGYKGTYLYFLARLVQ
jgi:2-polyprenyl-3-methyl-5-hydroxy-6-metoxy-1,4-benzoquinol methylase